MFNLTLRKTLTVIVLLSLILQSCGPMDLIPSGSLFSIFGGVNYPSIEPTDYQHPIFKHPEPRIGRNNPAPVTSFNQPVTAPNGKVTPVPSSIPANGDNTSNGTSRTQELGTESATQAINVGGINWILNGNADNTTIPGAIKLTDNDNMLGGSAWASQQIDLRQNFDLTFAIYLGNRETEYWSADGIAFVLQNVGTNVLGALGGGLGYAEITPSVAVEFDTFSNTEANDPFNTINGHNNHVALLKNGSMYHDGSLPLVQPWSGFENGQERIFRFIWNAQTKNLKVLELWSGGSSSYIDYTEDFVQSVFGGNPYVWFGFTGATASGTNLQYFYPSSGIVPNSATNSGSECNVSSIPSTQGYEGGPINTRTGGYYYLAKDIAIQTGAGEISFTRTYSTKALYLAPVGYGWTYNHDLYLLIGTYGSDNTRKITFKSCGANQYTFTQQNGHSTTSAEPGVYATLVQGASSFILTNRAQGKYEFNLTTGKLISYTNPAGQKILYTFDGKGRLTKISDQGGQRYLTLAYSGNGTKIISITDHTGRRVSYGYDSGNNLTSVTDPLGKIWGYTYDSGHRILQVLDPNNSIIERTEYDTQGRAVRQFDGMGNLVVELIYNADGTTTIRDAQGNFKTHNYGIHNTLKSQTDPNGGTSRTTFDANFRPATLINPTGNTTSLTWSVGGADLLRIVYPLNGQIELTYNANHSVTSYIDQNGYLTTYNYSGSNLTSITDALNGTWSYAYTLQGNLASQTDPLGHTTSYTYNAKGQRLSMTDPLGKTWNYTYDNLGRLITVTDPLGRVTRNEYDAVDRLIKTTRNYNASYAQNHLNLWNIVTQFQYDVRGNQTTALDTYGRATTYQYDAAGRLTQITGPMGNTTAKVYDSRGMLSAVTDARGNTTSYQYDAAGRVISITDPLGGISRITYNLDGTIATKSDALNRVTSYTYDELKRVKTITDPMGGVASYTYDVAGRVIALTDSRGATNTYEYDALGRVIRQTAPNGGVTETFYDAAGNKIQTIDPLGHATTYTYDDANRLLTVTDARGGVTRYAYDDTGRRISVTDANNHTTTYAYDALDRTTTVTDPLGNVTQTQYDAMSNVTTQIDANNNTTTYQYDVLYRLLNQTNALNGMTAFTYDSVGNRLTVTDPNNHTTTTSYDALNRPATVLDANGNSTATNYDAVDNLISTTDGFNHTTVFGYDDINHQSSVTDAMNHATFYGYDTAGNRVSMTDANGILTRYEYDNMGWLVAVVENYRPGSQADSETNVRTEFTYDLNGNILTLKDGNGHVSTFTYDELNRLVQESDALGHTWTYYYDAVGNQTSIVDANGVTIQYTYDNANRLTGINYPNGTPDVIFAYDAAGRRTHMTDGAGTTTWTFDQLNRPTAIQDPFGATVGYGYDAVGNRTSLTYPGGGTAAYVYDPGDRLTAVTGPSSGATYTYDTANRLTKVSRANGVDTLYTYDNANHLLSLIHSQGQDTLASYQYTLDAVGNRTQVIEQVAVPGLAAYPAHSKPYFAPQAAPKPTKTPTPTVTPSSTPTPVYTPTYTPVPTETLTPTPTFTPGPTNTPTITPTPTNTPIPPIQTTVTINYDYDSLYRLTAADYSDGKFYQYAYDSVGNRLTQQSHVGNDTYTYDNANRLTNVNGTTYAWDNNGNLLNDGTRAYAYDAANRLTSVNGTDSFTYNGLGDRLTQNGVRYTLDLNSGLTQILSDGSNIYLYGLGRISENQGGSTEYYLGDALGSVRHLVDGGGTITLTRNYDPFGKTEQTVGMSQTDYGFTGEFTDPTGLVYLRARHYSPEIGRFLTRDTWDGDNTNPQSLNRYSYGLNNPALYTDPTGHFAQIIVGATVGAALGIIFAEIYAEITYYSALNGDCGCDMQQWAVSVGYDWVSEVVIYSALIGAVSGAIASTGPVGVIIVGVFGITASAVDALRTAYQVAAQGGFDTCTLLRFVLDVVGYISSAAAISAGVNASLTGLSIRAQNMLQSDVGYNVSPENWFNQYATLGRKSTYITDYAAIADVIGQFKYGGTMTITSNQATALELALGLNLGSLGSGFRITRITGISTMSPELPTSGNQYFLGYGNGLPGGGPEFTITPSIPTHGTNFSQLIVTVAK